MVQEVGTVGDAPADDDVHMTTLDLLLESSLPEDDVLSAETRQELCDKVVTAKLDRHGLEHLDAADFARLPNLRSLHLQYNRLASAEPLAALTALRFLSLAHNDLTTCCGLKPLESLMTLDVSHNRIASIGASDLPRSLRFLHVAGNPCCSDMTRTGTYQTLLGTLPHLRELDGALLDRAFRRTLDMLQPDEASSSEDEEDSDASSEHEAAADCDPDAVAGVETRSLCVPSAGAQAAASSSGRAKVSAELPAAACDEEERQSGLPPASREADNVKQAIEASAVVSGRDRDETLNTNGAEHSIKQVPTDAQAQSTMRASQQLLPSAAQPSVLDCAETESVTAGDTNMKSDMSRHSAECAAEGSAAQPRDVESPSGEPLSMVETRELLLSGAHAERASPTMVAAADHMRSVLKALSDLQEMRLAQFRQATDEHYLGYINEASENVRAALKSAPQATDDGLLSQPGTATTSAELDRVASSISQTASRMLAEGVKLSEGPGSTLRGAPPAQASAIKAPWLIDAVNSGGLYGGVTTTTQGRQRTPPDDSGPLLRRRNSTLPELPHLPTTPAAEGSVRCGDAAVLGETPRSAQSSAMTAGRLSEPATPRSDTDMGTFGGGASLSIPGSAEVEGAVHRAQHERLKSALEQVSTAIGVLKSAERYKAQLESVRGTLKGKFAAARLAAVNARDGQRDIVQLTVVPEASEVSEPLPEDLQNRFRTTVPQGPFALFGA